MQVQFKKRIKWIIVIIAISIFAILYRIYNPEGNIYFPKCPFKALTGYKCPGCGSQRAIHYLLNLDILNAIRENVILVVFIPYLLLGFVFELLNKPSERVLKWRRILFGRNAIFVILLIIIGFWILRNIPCFNFM